MSFGVIVPGKPLGKIVVDCTRLDQSCIDDEFVGLTDFDSIDERAFDNLVSAAEYIGQIVAEVWRLVVARILPRDAHTIEMIGHEAGDGILGRGDGAVDVEGGFIRSIPHHDFFAPVAVDVGYQAGSCLCVVARLWIAAIGG